ncbi:Transcriptional regulatory protein [Thoreauomyces humboldtii]|nr:Transcriptional regulatory protein [Thoreauomyces humboldtii]
MDDQDTGSSQILVPGLHLKPMEDVVASLVLAEAHEEHDEEPLSPQPSEATQATAQDFLPDQQPSHDGITARTPSPGPLSPSKNVAENDLATRSNGKRGRPERNDRSRHAHAPRPPEILADDDPQEITRREALQSLTEIEQEFAKFREMMYQEKLAQVEAEEAALEDGTHPLLVSQMLEAEQKKDDRLAAANARLQQEQISFERQFQAALSQAQTDYICRRGEERRRLLAGLDAKRWRMHDERRRMELTEFDISLSAAPDRSTMLKRRKALKADLIEWKVVIASGGFPAATISGLTRSEINEDLEAIGLVTPKVNGSGGRVKRRTGPVAIPDASFPNTTANTSATHTPALTPPTPRPRTNPVSRRPATPISKTKPEPTSLTPPMHPPVLPPPLSQQHHPPVHPVPPPQHQQHYHQPYLPPPLQIPLPRVHIDGDVLHYDDIPYGLADKLFLLDHGARIAVKIVSIGNAEVIVQRTDGSKTKIHLEHLKDGRMLLEPKIQA